MALESLNLLEHEAFIPCRTGAYTLEVLQNLFFNTLLMHWFFQTSLPTNITDVLGRGKVRVVCLESLARKYIPLLEAFYVKNFSNPNFNT